MYCTDTELATDSYLGLSVICFLLQEQDVTNATVTTVQPTAGDTATPDHGSTSNSQPTTLSADSSAAVTLPQEPSVSSVAAPSTTRHPAAGSIGPDHSTAAATTKVVAARSASLSGSCGQLLLPLVSFLIGSAHS